MPGSDDGDAVNRNEVTRGPGTDSADGKSVNATDGKGSKAGHDMERKALS